VKLEIRGVTDELRSWGETKKLGTDGTDPMSRKSMGLALPAVDCQPFAAIRPIRTSARSFARVGRKVAGAVIGLRH
jgi:hypothetical protein